MTDTTINTDIYCIPMNPIIPSIVSIVNLLYFAYCGIDNIVYLTFATINVFITTWVMFNNERQPFTEIKIVNLFIYVFFILANAVQFSRNTSVLTFRLILSDSDFVSFQIIVSLILLLLNGFYSVFHKFYYKSEQQIIRDNPYNAIVGKHKTNVHLLLTLSLVSFLVIFANYGFNPMRMLFRGVQGGFGDDAAYGNMVQTGKLLLDNFIRPIPFAVLMVFILNKVAPLYRRLAFILMLITVFPTSLARNATAMYWLPIFVLYLGKFLRHNMFMWGMLFALFVLFPFLNLFRGWSGSLNFEWSMEFFNDINFDTGQIFMATIKTDMITYGYQLLGPLFFYIPRSWWPNKPIGSGSMLVDANHGFFHNVSMPYFGEGYINFGAIGVVIFVIFLAWLCAKLDVVYWLKWKNSSSYKIGYYLIFMGALVFILRGDLLSSAAYTIGIMISYTVCVWAGTNQTIFKLHLRRK